LIITPKMRKEAKSYIEKLINSKNYIQNFDFRFIENNQDPDEELLKYALLLKCPIITNDKFKQSKYDAYRNKNIIIWNFKYRYSKQKIVIDNEWNL